MAPPPTSHPALPPDPPFLQLQDELLEEIFHRLPAADHLACVSSACATFRRVITDHAFLRRYRALHPPPLIGMHHKPFIFAQPPHPSAVPARAFADFDFSCSSFLPSPAGRSWSKLDFFDGRALVADAPVENTSGKSFLVGSEVCDLEYQEFLVRDLAVCDPVHRRYVMLPAVPDGLKALVRRPDLLSLETFLAPGEDEENPLSFRVICLAHCRMNLLLLVFSSLGGQWDAFTCDRWSARATCASFVRSEPGLSNRRYANGCFYWHLHFLTKVLVFDARTMEFYAVDLPPEQDWPLEFVVVEATEETLGILIAGADEDNRDDQCWLMYSILRNNKWHSEKVIPLPAKNASLLGVAGGYLLIEALYTTSPQEKPKCRYFSVDVKTLQVELFAALSKPIFSGLLYAGFPPSLCAPTL